MLKIKNHKVIFETKLSNISGYFAKILYIYLFFFQFLSKISESKIKTKKLLKVEYNDIQEFINKILAEKNKPIKFFNKVNSPRISIIIPLFNGERYIKTALLSIQNQDLTDIEIIMIDDCSEDNTINIVKEFMEKDKRIILYQNEENKGTLYTKVKGFFYSNSKYVMLLDEDDMFVQKDAFSTLYFEAEKYNLDMVGFSSILDATFHVKKDKKNIYHYYRTPVIYQPEVKNENLVYRKNGEIQRVGHVIWVYFYKTELFKQVIKQIDSKYMNTKMICHEDFMLLFLLTRKAFNLKQMNRIFHIKIKWGYETNYHSKVKNESLANNLFCLSYINYIEFILMKTDNNINDKKIASFELKSWLLDNKCRNNSFIKKRAENICKIFLKNRYIENKMKKEIRKFLNNKTKFTKETIV